MPDKQREALDTLLQRMAATVENADADLLLEMGGYQEHTRARLWQGQVLVEWERDDTAGGCLVRPELVRRLALLGAALDVSPTGATLRAGPRVVASLSESHARLEQELGQPADLTLRLSFQGADGPYVGGEEVYVVRGRRGGATLLRLTATVQPRVSSSPQPLTR